MGASRVGDLTVDELRMLIREELEALVRDAVRDTLAEFATDDVDPDAGLEFRPEIAERLRRFQREGLKGRPLDEVVSALGLEDA